ncbi:MAG: glutaredoxin family protein [Pseudomonadota bacterium]|nr:glutaredoxin family protein [Pseudomonadota bacterium]
MAPTPPFRSRRRACFLLFAGTAFCAGPALAQYKVVQPDGRVLYTDIPPVTTDARITPLNRRAAAPARDNPLPDPLRRVAERYPVTLYTAADCEPCVSGRQLLQQRGVPYQERSIASNEDTLALERIVGSRTVPSLTIGSQPVRGYSAPEWGAYLDAAGYPRESGLPANWQPPAPRTLVERTAAPEPAPTTSSARPAPRSQAQGPDETASGGIRF